MLWFSEEEVNDLGVNVALSMLKFYKSKFVLVVFLLLDVWLYFLFIKWKVNCPQPLHQLRMHTSNVFWLYLRHSSYYYYAVIIDHALNTNYIYMACSLAQALCEQERYHPYCLQAAVMCQRAASTLCRRTKDMVLERVPSWQRGGCAVAILLVCVLSVR